MRRGRDAKAAAAMTHTPDFERPLFDSFDGEGFAEEGGLYYKLNNEQSAGIVEFQKEVTYSGGGALKLTVRPLGRPLPDDASERAEVWERPRLWVPYFRGVWYGFAVKFFDPPQDNRRYMIAQWKREILPNTSGDFSPFLALRLRRGSLFATVETNYHAPVHDFGRGVPAKAGKVETPVWLRPELGQMRALVATDENWHSGMAGLFHATTDKIRVIDRGGKLPSPNSGWIDFVVYSQPGPDGSGRIELFANGKWVVTVEGHIGHGEPFLGPRQYFKFGPYRAPHDKGWTLYFDDFRRSFRREDVLVGPGGCRVCKIG